MTLGRLPERARGLAILAVLLPAMVVSLYLNVLDENERRQLMREVACTLNLEVRRLWSIQWTDTYRAVYVYMDRRDEERKAARRAELLARLEVGDRVKAIRMQTTGGRGHPERLVQASATLVAFEKEGAVRVVFDDSGRVVTRSVVEVYSGLPGVEPDDGSPLRTADPTD